MWSRDPVCQELSNPSINRFFNKKKHKTTISIQNEYSNRESKASVETYAYGGG
jgi:hypothetical protein